MHVLNETGPSAGRFLYHTHETLENGQVTVTDLRNNTTRVLAQRADWNRLDGIVWTPWRTLLVTEEMRPLRTPSLPDPNNPLALAGLVYEVDPKTGESIARPALGAKAHEGIRFDSRGNIYGISETAPSTVLGGVARPGGYIFKFTPDRPGDLRTGQLYALKIVHDFGERTGEAIWLPLNRAAVRIDADAEATRVGATGYARPEDVETATSTGNDVNPGENLYVAVTDENRVLKVTLNDDDDDDHRGRERDGNDDRRGDDRRRGDRQQRAFVSDYVRAGVNAPGATSAVNNRFSNPDNLALDKAGNLFITEDTTNEVGMDIWVASPSRRGSDLSARVVRFASLADCSAEPSGVYFDLDGDTLYVHTLHRDGQDLSVAITQRRYRWSDD
jgi:secreted PhoX family phosphatase